ncbi:MAG: hypothetical protein VX589_02175 [Myxococcota bacterium]|nr:hypothetical protein [Myxococcota bacterium]
MTGTLKLPSIDHESILVTIRLCASIFIALSIWSCGSRSSESPSDLMGRETGGSSGAAGDQVTAGGAADVSADGTPTMPAACQPIDVTSFPQDIEVSTTKLALCQVLISRQLDDAPTRLAAVFTYDESGQLILEEYVDGQRDEVRRRIARDFDGQGRRLRLEEDRDGDGVPDTRIVSTFDANAPQMRLDLHDENADGQAEFREQITFDSMGRMIRLARLGGQADEIDYVDEWIYDDSGQRLSMTRRLASMEIVRIETRTYDAMGRLTSIEDRNGSDRILKLSARSTYDPMPCRRTTEIDSDGDGQRDRQIFEDFDGFNRLSAQTIRFDDMSQMAVTIRHQYEGDQLTVRMTDIGDDQSDDQVESYAYDPLGRLVRYDRVERVGAVETRHTETRQYTGCP